MGRWRPPDSAACSCWASSALYLHAEENVAASLTAYSPLSVRVLYRAGAGEPMQSFFVARPKVGACVGVEGARVRRVWTRQPVYFSILRSCFVCEIPCSCVTVGVEFVYFTSYSLVS